MPSPTSHLVSELPAPALVRALSSLGPRNARDDARYGALNRARDLILAHMQGHGVVRRHAYMVEGRTFENLELEIAGSVPELPALVLGAHYDSMRASPGANDNATGIACLLSLLRFLSPQRLPRTVRLVAFTNEEPPFTHSRNMGSLVYARRCRARGDRLLAMLSLETLGYTRDRESGVLFLVSNLRSARLLASLRRPLVRALGNSMPVRRVAAPGFLPGVKSSDHWSFWKCGYRAVMLTTGGPLQYRHYHRKSDRVEHVELAHLEDLTAGVADAVQALAQH